MTERWRAAILALVGAAGCGSIVTCARSARAQGDDVATAQILFDDGKRLMAQGRWTDACPKLQESQHLAPAIGTEYNLADCWEHAGRLASAWAAYLDVVDQTHRRGESQREAAARARADGLASRLGKLTVQVPSPAQGQELFRDSEPLPPEIWGVAVPVDAGVHRIEARAPGRQPWTVTVRTADGATATTAVPALAVAATAAVSPVTAPPSSSTGAASPPPSTADTANAGPVPPASSSADHTAAFIVLGAAVVFAGVGVVGLIEHTSEVNAYNADSTCPPIDSAVRPAHCDDYVNQANTWSTVGIVGFASSGIALAAGVTLWLLAPRHATAAASLPVTMACSPGVGGAVCGGTF